MRLMHKGKLLPVLLISVLFFISACSDKSEPTVTQSKAPDAAMNLTVDESIANTPKDVSASVTTCLADKSWITNPNPPAEIPGGGANFCEFYQFSWQWLLALMSPSAVDPTLRNFQVAADYPVLQVEGDSCSSTETAPVFFVRMVKDEDENGDFVLPERIGQAGGGATIYDQNGNVVFYSIRFDRGLCNASTEGDLPVGTLELKLAWRVISEAEKANYVWINADVITDDNDVEETLGLIGIHLVKSTAGDPEMVWTSFEHKNNAPNCINPLVAPAGGWSFSSQSCSSCLETPNQGCFNSCQFNVAAKATALTGTPSEICRVFPEGTAQGDYKAAENIADVKQLNAQLVGSNGLLTQLPATHPLAVLKNYFTIGSLWVNDPNQTSSTSNQRGSMQLANPVMETTFQGALSFSSGKITNSTQAVVNCFACHNYQPGKTASTGLSHIFDDIHKQ